MPVDVEGHIGLDNRFYVIDTARCAYKNCSMHDFNTVYYFFSVPTSYTTKRVNFFIYLFLVLTGLSVESKDVTCIAYLDRS